MAIVTWYTQPARSFSSFYYLDTVTRDMIRIRLELGRAEENGYPMVIASKNRYVGFGTNEQFNTIFTENRYKLENWHIVEGSGKLYYQKGAGPRIDFPDTPTAGQYLADFSVGSREVHFGNAVTAAPRLPRSAEPAVAVDGTMLLAIAKKYAGKDTHVKICEKDSTEATLALALAELAKPAAPEEEKKVVEEPKK